MTKQDLLAKLTEIMLDNAESLPSAAKAISQFLDEELDVVPDELVDQWEGTDGCAWRLVDRCGVGIEVERATPSGWGEVSADAAMRELLGQRIVLASPAGRPAKPYVFGGLSIFRNESPR